MGEPRKPVARIQLPVRPDQGEIVVPPKSGEIGQDPAGGGRVGSDGSVHGDAFAGNAQDSAQGVHLLMSKSRPPVKRDPLLVPMVGLLLAFSVISLIVQLLIAFS
jgi:hypothetical protein